MKRLFSSDYRAALSAEAAGDYQLAAERYALAGEREAAVRMHLARANRAEKRADEIDALRDALHWAPEGGKWRRRACSALGEALLARAKAEGIATERDKKRVIEAARLLEAAGRYELAGDAYLEIGDDRAAANAFRSGGLVEKMEAALSRDNERFERTRRERSAFADYQLHIRGGDRDRARDALRECLNSTEERADYRRLLDELESRLITGGRVGLLPRKGSPVTLCAGDEIVLGRDAQNELALRTGGVSRRHAVVRAVEEHRRYLLSDAGSRNGTKIGGMAIADGFELRGQGSFGLGDDVEVLYQVDDGLLMLSIRSGLDAGQTLIAGPEGAAFPLDFAREASIYFRDGRPFLQHPAAPLQLNGETLAHGEVQLIHGDLLVIGGNEVEVL